MAKKEKEEVVKAEKAEKAQKGEFHNPFPWVAPYPASYVGKDGEEVFVRATVHQEITVSGNKFKTGQQTLPCNIAHQCSHALSAPITK